MKYVVTGGAGFIGSHIADALVERGDEVVIIDDFFSGRLKNIQHLLDDKSILLVERSIYGDIGSLEAIFKDVDGIFHEAAITSVPRSIKNPYDTNMINISGTLNVLIAAERCGVGKVVFASSSSVYGNTKILPKREDMKCNPISPYAVSKLAGENYCQVYSSIYNLPTVCLRYFNVFGERQDPNSEYAAVIPKFISRIRDGKAPIIYGDGNQTRDFTYVKDVVQANLLAMDKNVEGIFNIAYDNQTSVRDLALMISDIMRMKINLIFDESREGDVKDSRADISLAKSKLGYDPKYTVKSGLQEMLL